MDRCLRFASFLVLSTSFQGFGLAQTAQKVWHCPENPAGIQVVAEVKSVEKILDDSTQTEFRFRLAMHVINRGTEAVILGPIEDQPWIGGDSVSATREDALGCRPLSDRSAWRSLAVGASVKMIAISLYKPMPPERLTRTIKPNDEWIFEEDHEVGFSKNGNPLNGNKPYSEVRLHDPLWFEFTFQIWDTSLPRNAGDPNFADTLRKKWRKY